MLVLADKLSNMRSIARDYAALGDGVWERFNAPKEKQAWYYGGIINALKDLNDIPKCRDNYQKIKEIYDIIFG
jgi:myo-inositol-1(or 4)-monophosphatase